MPSIAGAGGGRELQQVQGHPAVAVRVPGDRLDGRVADLEREVAEPPFRVRQRAPQDGHRVGLIQRIEHEHLRPREQRGVDLEGRVLGGGADEDDVAGLDAGQERVLLGLVEAVNLVDEEDRPPPAMLPRALGFRHHVPDLLDAGEHRGEGDEVRLGRLGDQPRQAGLARARRAPEDDRLEQVPLDGLAQRPPRGEQILLADVLVERAWAHALRERRPAGLGRFRGVAEEVGVRHG